MSTHYNAFISYRHAPLDIQIAAEVQTRLERFRVPRAIRKATGMSQISRIFRDKDELLSTSDLNAVIQDALNNSDYLIVICSRRTKESIWVQKEIEFFLKTHPKERILTVLCEGEPYEVIPEILLNQQITVTAEDGTTQTVTIPAEPLSCDYRLPRRRARREELPRLAATLLGCSYGDLRRRQQRYRMQRLAIGLSTAALALISLALYYAWSANAIAKSLTRAQISQSQYLSAEAINLLKSGDRMSAILLALEALPQPDSPRPVIPEAEFALSQATYAYVTAGENRYDAVNAFSHSGQVDDFLLSRDEAYLAVSHSRGSLTVWDTRSFDKLWEKTLPDDISAMALTEKNTLLLLTSDVLLCLDLASGETVWQFQQKGIHLGYGSLSLSDAASLTAVRSIDASFAETVLLVDLDTGTLQHRLNLPEELGFPFGANLENICFSPDGRTLAMVCDATGFSTGGQILLFHLESQSFLPTTLSLAQLEELTFTPGGMLLAAGQMELRDYSMTITSHNNTHHVFADGLTRVACIHPETGSILWEQDISYGLQYHGVSFQEVTAKNAAAEPLSAIACTVGNTCQILDAATGQLIRSAQYPASPVETIANPTRIRTILSNGMVGSFSESMLFTSEYFLSPLEKAVFGEGEFDADVYALQDRSSAVLLYRWGLRDENWQTRDTLPPASDIQDLCYTGSRLLLRLKENRFVCIDAATKAPLWEKTLEGTTYEYTLLQPDDTEENFLIYHSRGGDNPGEEILRLSAQTGEASLALDLDAALLAPVDYGKVSPARSSDGQYTALAEDGSIRILDAGGRELCAIPWGSRSVYALRFHEDLLLVLYSTGDLCRYGLDGSLMGQTEVLCGSGSRQMWTFTDDGNLALYSGGNLNLIRLDSWKVYTQVVDCFGFCSQENLIFACLVNGSQESLGWFPVYPLEALIQRGQAMVRDACLTDSQLSQYGLS